MKPKTIGIVAFLLLFLSSFRFFLFVDGTIGHNWDWTFPSLDIFFSNLNLLSLFAWNNFGLGEVADLKLAHLAQNLIFGFIGELIGPKLFLFSLFFLITLFSFYGFKRLLDFLTEDYFLNYIPSFLYAFSPFFFNDIIGGSWVMWVSYALCPTYFILVVKYFKTNGIKYLLSSLITSIFIIISIQNFILINLLIVMYLFYEITVTKNIKNKGIVKNAVILLFLLALTNFYWIFPFFYSFGSFTQSAILSDGGVHEFDPIKNSTQNIWNIFNLGGYLDRNMYLYSMPLALKYLFQLVVALAWILVLGYFIKEKNKIRMQKTLFWMLSLLILMIIVKGGNSPFRGLTLWLYNNFPLMRLYRSPQHLMLIPAFIIPILITFSLNYFYKNSKYKKTVGIIFSFIVMIWISGWWFNGDLGHKTLLEQKRDHIDFYQLPPELVRYYKESQKDVRDYRSFFLPAVFSPAFLKTEFQDKAQGVQPEYLYLDKPTFTSESNKFADKVEVSFCEKNSFDYIRYLSLFSVKNIILRSDIYPHFTESAKCWSDGYVRTRLESSVALEKFLSGEYATAYRVKEDYFLPHFYIPQNMIYANGGIESLADIVSFEDYELKSGIYLGGSSEILNMADGVFVKADLENPVDKDYFEKLEAFKNSVPFPFVRHKPGSFFYLLVLKKEQFEEEKARKSLEELVEKKLFYAGKRISEFEKFGMENADKELMARIMKEYQGKLEETVELVRSAVEKINGDKETNRNILKLRAYWERHKEKIREIFEEKLKYVPLDVGTKYEEIFKNWEEVFEELDREIKNLEKPFDLRNLKYSFEIPRKGTYSLFLSTDNAEGVQITLMTEEGMMVTETGKTRKDRWISFGKRDFKEGTHSLVLRLPEAKNLAGDNRQKLEEIVIKEEGVEFFPQSFFPETKNLVFQEINNWQANGLYYLGFDYKIEEGSLVAGVLEEKRVIEDGEQVVRVEKIFNKALGSRKKGKWEKHETVLRANSQTLGARVYFYALSGPNQSSKVDFENLKIYKITQPKIVLWTNTENTGAQMAPRITFAKINPTKYKVRVEGAKVPYILVFSESFHKGWKAYLDTQHATRDTQHEYGSIVASYFGGEIKEGEHKNVFLDRNTFETWGKKPVPEERHYLVNGYANSWYITPEDSKWKENYEIIIEFWTQRIFYLGLGISLLTLIGLVGYLGYDFAKRKKEEGGSDEKN